MPGQRAYSKSRYCGGTITDISGIGAFLLPHAHVLHVTLINGISGFRIAAVNTQLGDPRETIPHKRSCGVVGISRPTQPCYMAGLPQICIPTA